MLSSLIKSLTLGSRWLDCGLGYAIAGLHQLNLWIVFPVLVLTVLTDIALRTFLNSPLSWAHEFLGLLLICLFFLELPHNVRRRDFLQIDLLYLKLGRIAQRGLNLLAWLAILAFAVLVAWQGYLSALEMYEFEEQATTLPIPYWPLSAFICSSGVLMALQAGLKLFNEVLPAP
ncbi:MAG: TRAP transporter small permease [Hahellaceae bacterium]|nr:TRAP transporter small permease [Hahellaceae bacterium]MCP5169619.1 TRAP transporter small permease [Hahellaceae bacterium]